MAKLALFEPFRCRKCRHRFYRLVLSRPRPESA